MHFYARVYTLVRQGSSVRAHTVEAWYTRRRTRKCKRHVATVPLEVHPQVQHGEVVLPGLTLLVRTFFTKPER
jgi:hypothetical protein